MNNINIIIIINVYYYFSSRLTAIGSIRLPWMLPPTTCLAMDNWDTIDKSAIQTDAMRSYKSTQQL